MENFVMPKNHWEFNPEALHSGDVIEYTINVKTPHNIHRVSNVGTIIDVDGYRLSVISNMKHATIKNPNTNTNEDEVMNAYLQMLKREEINQIHMSCVQLPILMYTADGLSVRMIYDSTKRGETND